MIYVDLLGHFFYFWIITGTFLIAKRNIWGWGCKFVGDIGWFGLGIYLGLTSIWMWEIVFMGLNLYGLREWRRYDSTGND